MDVLGFGERGEGAGRRVRVRSARMIGVLRETSSLGFVPTLTPTPLPKGDGLCAA
jgi:hypothetical protein